MGKDEVARLMKKLQELSPSTKIEFGVPLKKDILGTFKGGVNTISISKEAEENEKVIAHEIAHAVEFKRHGHTSHRNRYHWENMSRILGVPLIVKSPSGRTTVRATEFRERTQELTDKIRRRKYRLFCPNCGWETFYLKENKFTRNVDCCKCPKCHGSVVLNTRQ